MPPKRGKARKPKKTVTKRRKATKRPVKTRTTTKKRVVCKGGMCRLEPKHGGGSASLERGKRKKLNLKRPSPAESAVGFPIGTLRPGKYGRLYIVKGVHIRGKLVHRWVPVKDKR